MLKKMSIISVFLMLFGFSGCGYGQNVEAPAQPLRTDVKAAIGPEPATIDPGKNIDTYVSVYISHVFEGLARYDEKNNIVPAAAENWDMADDGLTYTFHIRKNASWSDGKKLTAQDF